MPNWHEINNELKESGSSQDIIRRKYLNLLSEKTGRNTILYYSGWLQKSNIPGLQVNDADKNGLMTVIHKLERNKGLDLILHTPGGETAATESIVDYLKSMFGDDIRAIIPQLAMSAGTMIACSLMGKQSSLGPIDPQFGGIPAHGIVEEFKRAYTEIKADNTKMAVWQPILNKYNPTLVGECEKAIKWSEQMVEDWLRANMLNGDADVDDKVKTILEELGDHSVNLSHSRHLSSEKCKQIGLNVTDLEADSEIQDLVLSVHHSCIHTLSSTNAFKMIENQNGIAFIQSQQNMIVPR